MITRLAAQTDLDLTLSLDPNWDTPLIQPCALILESVDQVDRDLAFAPGGRTLADSLAYCLLISPVDGRRKTQAMAHAEKSSSMWDHRRQFRPAIWKG
jgi:hypothetical protein